jgi:hypothetical protein
MVYQKHTNSMKKKKRMGRPSKGKDARSIPVMVKLSLNERIVFERAAKVAGMKLGPWLIQPRRDELKGE